MNVSVFFRFVVKGIAKRTIKNLTKRPSDFFPKVGFIKKVVYHGVQWYVVYTTIYIYHLNDQFSSNHIKILQKKPRSGGLSSTFFLRKRPQPAISGSSCGHLEKSWKHLRTRHFSRGVSTISSEKYLTCKFLAVFFPIFKPLNR